MAKHLRHFKTFCVHNRIALRVIAMILSIITVFLVTPSVLYSEAIEAVSSLGQADDPSSAQSGEGGTASEQGGYTYNTYIYEDTERREENVKHFRLKDGSYVAAQYPYPVHVLENGEWVDIDNTLHDSSNTYSTPSARIKFAKHLNGNAEVFTIHDANGKLTMSLVGANKKIYGQITNYEDDETEDELGKMMSLEGLGSRIIYENALDGVDLEYVVHSLNVKENLIVKQKLDTGYSFSFKMALNNLSAALSADGAVIITDTEGDTVYTIPAPIVFDADGEYAPPSLAEYTLTEGNGNGKYVLTVSVSEEWMNDAGRAYPVTVDPTVSASRSYLYDTCINSSSPNTSYGNAHYLYVSATEDAFISVDLPEIPSDAYVTDAQLSLFKNNGIRMQVGAYAVNASWDEALTYNTHFDSEGQSIISTDLIDYADTILSGGYNWAITSLVREWYNGRSNYGIALSSIGNVLGSNYCAFISSENTSQTSASNAPFKPYFTVSYVDVKGMEDYYSYTSQSAGVAGSGCINLANGNLVFAIPTLTTTDYLIPTTVTLAYNSFIAGKPYVFSDGIKTANQSSYMPYGFKLNLHETIISEAYYKDGEASLIQYVLADSDGTEHYFQQSEANGSTSSEQIYYDTDGLRLSLEASANGETITVKSIDQSEKTFTRLSSVPSGTLGAWQLSGLTDKYGNSVSITYDTNNRPCSISLIPNGRASIEMLTLHYVGGKLAMVRNDTAKEAVLFKYSSTYNGTVTANGGNYLREVIFATGNDTVTAAAWSAFYSAGTQSGITQNAKAEYTYNSGGHLTRVKDCRYGMSVSYSYPSVSDHRVNSVSEYGSDGSIGQTIGITYSGGYTELRASGNDDVYNNSDDTITRYVFDSYARVKSNYTTNATRTEILGAISGSYETEENIKNNVKDSYAIGGSISNYVTDGDFSDPTSSSWLLSDVRRSIISDDMTSYNALSFDFTANEYPAFSQYLYLPAGTYTFSFDYVASGFSDIEINIELIPLDYEYFYGEYMLLDNTSTGSIVKKSFVFTTEPEATENRYILNFSAQQWGDSVGTPSFKITNLSIVRGINVTEHNLVDFGDFDSKLLDSSGEDEVRPIDYWNGITEETVFAAPFNKTGKVANAYISDEVGAWQTVFSSAQGGFDYVAESLSLSVSGFGYATHILPNKAEGFGIRVKVYYSQGPNDSVTREFYFPFEDSEGIWQFVSGTVDCMVVPEEGDTASYTFVNRIDIICEYNYPDSDACAYVDNITATIMDSATRSRNVYDERGNLVATGSRMKSTYYEYDSFNNVTRMATDDHITDYVYSEDGANLLRVVEYSYTNLEDVTVTENGETFTLSIKGYPYGYENPDMFITKTPLKLMEYEYNNFGQITDTSIAPAIYSNDEVIADPAYTAFASRYDYETVNGSKIFGAQTFIHEDGGNTTLNYYDSTNGRLLATINQQANNGECYEYDEVGRLVGSKPASLNYSMSYAPIENAESVEYTYTSGGLLHKIITESTEYTFSYDTYANTDKISIGSRNIVDYEYNAKNGKLKKIIYGNGFSEEYVYNTLELLSEVWYTNSSGTRTRAYKYYYDDNGQIYKKEDIKKSLVTLYRYDSNGRFIGSATHSGDYEDTYDYSLFHTVTYDSIKNIVDGEKYRVRYTVNDDTYTEKVNYVYTYDDVKDRINSFTVSGNGSYTENRFFDAYDRLSGIDRESSGGFFNDQEITYYSNSISKIDSFINSIGNEYYTENKVYEFSYNAKKYIGTIKVNGVSTYSYYYDDLGQLTRENNLVNNRTYVYTYDNAGNILTKTTYPYTASSFASLTPLDTVNYGYTNSTWGDLLTSYDGQSISYDNIGNPTSYYNGKRYSFTWSGRMLTNASFGGANYSFTYNDEGIRTSKNVNGTLHNYYLDGSTIIAEEWDGNYMVFVYDNNGSPIGFRYRESTYEPDVWDVYWLEKNLQGDVVGVWDDSGEKIMVYTYDAWGNFSEDCLIEGWFTTAYNNPFKYRGYYYDEYLDLYYLNARYYDPTVGRFINADDRVAGGGYISGCNMFTYCINNPVNMFDASGNWPEWIETTANWVNDNIIQPIKDLFAPPKPSNVVTVSSHDENKRPYTGEPGSTYTAPNGDTRTYGPDGTPVRDYDHNDHGQPAKHPHDPNGGHNHDWNNGERGPAYCIGWEAIAGVALVTICAIGIVAVAANDATGIGAADDFLFGPLGAGLSKGLILIFG